MTVLGEFVLPHGRSAWTQSLVLAMELLGVRDKAARQAIARMHGDGWLDRTRVGRQTRWTLTENAVSLLTAGAERIYGFGSREREWQGTWVVLLASVPERDRNVRYRMGVGLNWAGFGSLGQGTWLSPWPDREQVAADLMNELGIEATSFVGELGKMGSGSALAEAAWDLPRLREEYERFLTDTDPLIAVDRSGVAAVAELAAIVHRWRRFPFLDPDLPPALLPDDWPGPEAARRFGMIRAELLDPVGDWWLETEAEHTPSPQR